MTVPRRKAFGREVAGCEFVLRSADGEKRCVRVRVGTPYRESALSWRCPSEIRGFERRYADVAGVDSMQALCLAIALVRFRIEDFIDKGGIVFDTDGSRCDRRQLLVAFGAKPWRKGRLTRR
jgi:hypothetical protein